MLATCGNCHKDKQAAITKYSHMPLGEGKMECTSCHNPHGSAEREDADRELGERDLLQLSRREARPVHVGARSR